MSARTRWGILATGGIARAFADDLALLPDAELAAVGSRSPQAAREFADRYQIPRAHGSWRELAEDPDLDVIYVATPHVAHHEAARLCLSAGRAVLCEKPFTMNVAQAEELVRLARDRGLFLMEAMWMLTNPVVRAITEVVSAGGIGTVTAVSADFGLPGPFAATHRLRDPRLGGGALLDLGVYPVSLAHLLLGEPERIVAMASLTEEGVDQNTAVVLGYPGALATVYCGIVGDSPRRASIIGSTGRIEVPRSFHVPDRFTVYRGDPHEPNADKGEEFVLPLRGNGLGYEAEEVGRCLSAGLTESPLVPLDHTLAVMRTLDAVRAAIGVSYPDPA